jgi:UDP-glucose 4-epimerase
MVVKRALVTGCSGFIGTHLVNTLISTGTYVRGLSRQTDWHHPGVEVFHADLTRPETLEGAAKGIDTILHAAGHAHATTADADLHRQTTLEGTRNLLAESERSKVGTFVFISSVKAMAEPGDRCIDETARDQPEDEYGKSRRQAEDLVLDAGRRTGMHVSILRPTLVYGPGCKGNLAKLLRWIDTGIFPPVPDTGNKRSMVDVRDLINAILLAAEKDSASGKTFIITDNQNYSTRRIYNAMRESLGKPLPSGSVPIWLLRVLGRLGDGIEALLGRSMFYNSAMCSRLLDSACYRSGFAHTELGFHPKYRFEDALPDIVAEYWKNRDQAEKDC